MFDPIKKPALFVWVWILGIGALLVALVVYFWRRAAGANARALIATKRARIQITLHRARKTAQNREKAEVEAVEAEHTQKLEALHIRARDINEAAEDSRAALARAINRSFGR